MGQTLSEPLTEKHTTEGNDKRVLYGASSMQGWRTSKCSLVKKKGPPPPMTYIKTNNTRYGRRTYNHFLVPGHRS